MRRATASGHVWKFFRTGGLEQVSLESGADLLALGELDQKLWVALSCPVKGLELDEKTLALVDGDGDGRIAVPDVVAAVQWAAARLKDAGDLLHGTDGLPLAAIDADTPEGKVLLASAKQVLASGGQASATAITVAQASDTAKVFAANPLNGDGILVPEGTDNPAIQKLVKDIVDCTGGTARPSGAKGVTAEQVEKFFADLTAYTQWTAQSANKDIAILGDATAAAVAAIKAVRAKVDDFFARTRLATFDQRAIAALNRSENEYLAIAAKDLTVTSEELRALPLARVEAGKPLPLVEGVNPAWAEAIANLRASAVAPILGEGKRELTAGEWIALNGRVAAYETWLGTKASGAVEKIGLARAREILASDGRAALEMLAARDQELAPEFKAISDVERLVRYYRDLRTLLHNFVNFADFYSPDRYAAFQSGTLFLDSRSTELCIRVEAANPLAAMSKAYIAYCACTRADGAKMTIAACLTQGDSDYLFVGRNGIFYDRQGKLWYAVITSIIDNPISIRQAFWLPYKKFLRMIEEHIAKRAAAAETESNSRIAAAADKTANVDKTAKPTEPPKKLDIGTLAAIGVAISGAISALTLILGHIFDLKAWQYPLALLGIILVISGPSMIIAWLKLRQRTIGPILEANGWAINGRVKINVPFGAALTQMAALPPGAERLLDDPYEDKEAARRKRSFTILLVLLLLVGGAFAIRWDRNRRGHYFWQPAPAPASAAAPAAPAPATK